MAGNAAPDVFELNYENFVTYAANDTLMDISSYLSADTPFYPRALEAFQYDGKQMALPETFSTVLLFYNADLFDQAGLDYPSGRLDLGRRHCRRPDHPGPGRRHVGPLLARAVLGVLQEGRVRTANVSSSTPT